MILGISGKLRSGKSTLACRLAAGLVECGVYAEVASLAAPLKNCAQQLFGLSNWQVRTQEGKATLDPRWGLTPRQILQFLGTEALRDGFGGAAVRAGAWSEEESADFWVRVLLQRTTCEGGVYIVDDLRFPNEAARILADGQNNMIIRIDTLNAIHIDNHPGESALDDYDNFFMRLVREDGGDFDEVNNNKIEQLMDVLVAAAITR